jgi:aspartyl-tRNA(Asn)/glutamyl-tRNA(Gln) amidotransferase subunit C
MDSDGIKKLAALARLTLRPEEEERLAIDFQNILTFIEAIQKVSVPETVGVPEHRNVFREDGEPHETGVHKEALLAAAPHAKDGYISVKKVVEHGR